MVLIFWFQVKSEENSDSLEFRRKTTCFGEKGISRQSSILCRFLARFYSPVAIVADDDVGGDEACNPTLREA